MPDMDKIPTQDEYKEAIKGNEGLNKKIVKLGELKNLCMKI